MAFDLKNVTIQKIFHSATFVFSVCSYEKSSIKDIAINAGISKGLIFYYLENKKNLLGISNGVGDNQFAPERAITRQEMFTLFYSALKVMNQLPEANSGKTLSDFTDSHSISFYAQEAMAYLVENGVVAGNNGRLSPTATTTRAQMAQVLYNLLVK